MKTLIDISPQIIVQVQKLYQLKTKSDAIRFALNEAIRHKQLEKLANQLGSFDDFLDPEEVKKTNKNDTTRVFCLD